MSLENVYIFYQYANVIKKTLEKTLEIAETGKICPDVIANLQLETVSLNESLFEDFFVTKEILSEINCIYALWVNTGTQDEELLFIIFFVLNILLYILSNNYEKLSNESGFDFNKDETIFILIGQTLNDLQKQSLNAVKNSNMLNKSVENNEKIFEKVLEFGKLSQKFTK